MSARHPISPPGWQVHGTGPVSRQPRGSWGPDLHAGAAPGPVRYRLDGVRHTGKPLQGKGTRLENPGSHHGPVGTWSLSYHPGSLSKGPLRSPNKVEATAFAQARCFQDDTQLPRHMHQSKQLNRSGKIPGSRTSPAKEGPARQDLLFSRK